MICDTPTLCHLRKFLAYDVPRTNACACVCVLQELAHKLHGIPEDEQNEILHVLGGKRDTYTKNPQKDLQDLADWERITQLRKDAPLREFPRRPMPNFPRLAQT